MGANETRRFERFKFPIGDAKLNAAVALNVEIARFMSASTDVPFFTGLDNAATAEIEKSNGAYANAILSFAEAMLDSEDSTMKDTTIFV